MITLTLSASTGEPHARPSTGSGRALMAAACLVASSCGAPLMKLPAGPGVPAPDAADALAQATATCRGIRTLTAEVAASGKVNGQRFRARLVAGVAEPASARLEAVAPFGAPFFILAADNDDATLLLPRDARVLTHGRSADVLEAVAGVPLSASDLRMVLTGCAPPIATADGRALGADWRLLTTPDGDAYYVRRAGTAQPWQLAAVVRHAWRAEFRDVLNGLPRAIRIVSAVRTGAGAASFDLTLSLTQVETNQPLGREAFTLDVPRDARPITLNELRDARPGIREN